MVDEQDEKRITLRVPADIYETIVVAAKAKRMSVNSYIVQLLGDTQYATDLEIRIASVEHQLSILAKERAAMK